MPRFRLRKRKARSRQLREVPIRAMIPNLLTLLAAASGITSIRYSCQGQWSAAVIAIIVACVLDGMDGGVARILRATSRLGAELDSLADFVSFGVAPAVLVYFWMMNESQSVVALHPLRGFFWALALFYAMCCAFRLARFNVMLEGGPIPPYWRHFFMGLPAPGSAGLLITPLLWQLHTGSDFPQSPWVGGPMLAMCGCLMACRWPTLSLKGLRVRANRLAPALLVVMFVICMLVSQFWLTLGVIGILYFLSIPLCGFLFLRLRKRHDSHQPPSV